MSQQMTQAHRRSIDSIRYPFTAATPEETERLEQDQLVLQQRKYISFSHLYYVHYTGFDIGITTSNLTQ